MNDKQLATLKKNNEESREFIRSCFRMALMTILKGSGGSHISVTKLCKVAGASRTAFYRNYNDVEDVLDEEIEIFAHSLAGKIGRDVYDNWLMLFQAIDEYREDLEAIVSAGFEPRIQAVFLSLLPKNEENRTIQTIWLSLFYSLMIKWVKEKKPKKAEDMARLAYKYTKSIPLIAIE